MKLFAKNWNPHSTRCKSHFKQRYGVYAEERQQKKSKNNVKRMQENALNLEEFPLETAKESQDLTLSRTQD